MKKFSCFLSLSILLVLSDFQLFAQSLRIEQPLRFLALGDSYTIGESVSAQSRWPQQLYDSLAARGYQTESLEIIARTGWRTDNLASAMTAAQLDSSYNLVGLLIGVNNQYQGGSATAYAPEFEALLQAAIGLAGGNKEHVFVLSIPDYAFTPFGQGNTQISQAIDAFNAVNLQISQQYAVSYYDITPISREGLNDPSLVAGDGLHPSGRMYSGWVRQILADIPIHTTAIKNDLEGVSVQLLADSQGSRLLMKSRQAVRFRMWNLSGQLAIERENCHTLDILWQFPPGIYLYEVRNPYGKMLRGKLIY